MVSPGSELIIGKLKSFFDANASAFGADMVFLYGSLAGGNPRHDSDVDLAILFSPDTVGKDEVFDRVAELSARLSHLIKKEVNILVLELDFRKPMLQYNAIVLGIPVFFKDSTKFLHLRMEAVSQMEDFSIFGRTWQLEVAKRRIERMIHG